jgi:hypothetical protein
MSSAPSKERKAQTMTYRNTPLLVERSEYSSETVEAAPHHRANQEIVSHDKQEEPLHTVGNAAQQGLLLNRNFAWLACGQAISNLGDFVFSTTLLIWVFTLTHSAAAVSGCWQPNTSRSFCLDRLLASLWIAGIAARPC